MTTQISKLLMAGAACAGLIAMASNAMAQAAAPRPAAAATAAAAPAPHPAVPQGPPIPGVCIFWQNAAVANSAVGKFVIQRLDQLQKQVEAELTADATALQNDERALETQKATLSTDVYEQRAAALKVRERVLQRKAEQRQRELEATQQKALGRIVTESNPLLAQVYSQRNCSLLLDHNGVFGSNTAMEITPDVIKLLDTKITQFQFDRERLDQQPTAPAAAPARQ